MTKIIRKNATEARKDLFKLMDQVGGYDVKVVLTKEGLDSELVLQKNNYEYATDEEEDQMQILRDTAGSLKTKGYDPDEVAHAEKLLTEKYRKEYGVKN